MNFTWHVHTVIPRPFWIIKKPSIPRPKVFAYCHLYEHVNDIELERTSSEEICMSQTRVLVVHWALGIMILKITPEKDGDDLLRAVGTPCVGSHAHVHTPSLVHDVENSHTTTARQQERRTGWRSATM